MTTYDPALIERLVAEAREEDTRTAVWLRAMADQLEAARAEVAKVNGFADGWNKRCQELQERNAEDEREFARAMTQLAADRDHWREARRIAMEAGDILKGERDALAAEVERLELLVKVHPDDIAKVVAENDRMHAAFDQAMTELRTPGMKVSSTFCTWCGQHWPKLDGESYEEARRYTMEHAETCPANDIRIERDALRVEVEQLKQRVRDQDEELQAHAKRGYQELTALDAAARSEDA